MKLDSIKYAELGTVLEQSSPEDLAPLVDYLTDSGKGRIALSKASCAKLVESRDSGDYPMATLTILAEELCKFGGNSIGNLFRRGEGVAYREVVQDVLEHLKGKAEQSESAESMEVKILQRIATAAWDRMDAQQRAEFQSSVGVVGVTGPAALAAIIAAVNLGGFATYQVSLQLASQMSRMLLGKGLTFAANATLARTLSVVAGPIGWVVTGLWTAYDLASPAYRVTVPCVVHIAFLRQKLGLNICAKCSEVNPPRAKFCNSCGAAMVQGSK